MPDFDLSADEQAMYEVIPKNGSTIGNYKARQHLGWDEERYWSAVSYTHLTLPTKRIV